MLACRPPRIGQKVLLYPHPSIRISKTKDAGGAVVTKVSTLHRDAVGSVRAVTTAAGARAEKALYRPYGEEQSQSFDLVTAPESAGDKRVLVFRGTRGQTQRRKKAPPQRQGPVSF